MPGFDDPGCPDPSASEPDQEYLAYKERGLARAADLIPNLQIERMENSIHDIPLQYPLALAKRILKFAGDL